MNPCRCQNTDSLQTLLGGRNLDKCIIAQLPAYLVGLLHHTIGLIAQNLHMQFTFLDEITNLLQYLIGRALLLGQNGRVTGYAVHGKILIHGTNIINIGVVNNQFHNVPLLFDGPSVRFARFSCINVMFCYVLLCSVIFYYTRIP